jgi:hypothetical protein
LEAFLQGFSCLNCLFLEKEIIGTQFPWMGR